MLDDRLQNLVQEQIHLHWVLVLLLLVLHELTIFDLNVEATVSVQLDQDILQGGEWFMIFLTIIAKHLDPALLL